ncbi:MAG: DNA polymerase III subunit alpha [Epsilonproteobacteria bacterium]|nr:DNA polymerase III subunit alpha [Campylobacterota bacterium]PIP10404.1 MAG: DNA polymerase III subunit alpha [Sulfurimonas sp. CG23_combo_of_CG06-09_8_20_14_all_36_33]PIS24977.1 MAG: DNA polymerase III subunit alpha [Sulfurimonas sp. CG08_land_8_20_14_0_20_36_33]PIU34146.1 MAG: DNA polymerase III subunit alpha [Sulfurimonas sp. CG07_land_8_20_14_0_80_36_56]PIV04980.1 MAG: DNA polymerase III subunit alpha [Sulfurimonas sp. CG03_land_8_20_14_0_80_36_25]PIV35458.1 MAG: DNA polymerase III subu
MSAQPFTHLHLHTEYSLLDGANKLSTLVSRVKELGMTSVAMTDHGNMFGAIDFYKQMKEAGLKPIIGMEGYIHNGATLDDKTTKQRFHICLYAKNKKGYENLMYLSSKAFIDGFYYFPRINKQELRDHSEGLICSSACLQGEVNWHLNLSERNLKNGALGYEAAKSVALEYKEIFGDDFYLELMRHGIGDQLNIDEQILKISQETGIKIVATNDTHYTYPDDAQYHEAFMCIGMNKLYDDPNRMRHSVHEFYIKSPEQMARLFADIPEALAHTQEIVDKCEEYAPIVKTPTPPNFKFTREYATAEGLNIDYADDAPLGKDASEEEKKKWFSAADKNDAEYFIIKCREGLENRLKIVPPERHQEYKERLEFEMNVINSMKFPGYMMIVWDFVKEAKRIGVAVGPGRGSAAGSLVAYSLDITDIDPMKYDLLFERFLNPERVSMPDIDMDFMQARRGEVIDYVVQKYGRNQVAQIITFGSLLAKGVIRDVARVLDMPLSQADKMAKLVPDELGITLNGKTKGGEFKEGAFQKEPKLQELIASDPNSARVWEFAKKLEGLKRNSGMHAAGVVISNEELWKKTPIYKPSGETTFVTQYSLNFLEDVDLIKFDFLGLKTLDVIDNAIKLIKRRYDKDIHWHLIDENDKKVYDVIQTGETVGMFQIESSGMQDLNKRLKPSNFEDLIAVLALYRPGPMESGMLDDFIERKHGRQAITYVFSALEDILKPTYGVIVYQEQVMQIVQTIGGMSLGGADIVRRAMGKKKVEEMLKYNKEFSLGAQKQGLDYDKASKLFDLIEKFAGYGFNKSHSAAYAMVTFQTAWLKTYYPNEFMAALLTSDKDNTDKVVRYIDEVKRMGIELSPPDVNDSYLEFSAITKDEKDIILFGLGAIKGVGEAAVESIIQTREEDGEFTSIENFVNRIDPSKVNKRFVESSIKSGGFDRFGFSRKALLDQIELIVETAKKASDAKKKAVGSLFGDDTDITTVKLELRNSDEYTLKEILEFEKETLGFYVSGHPLDEYRASMDELNYTLSSELENIKDGSSAIFIGKVEEIQKKTSKKGNQFGIVSLMDFHGNIEIMLFADKLEQLADMNLEEPVAFKVKVTHTEMFTRISVTKIMTLKDAIKETKKVKKEVREAPPEPLNLAIKLDTNMKALEELYRVVRQNPGNRPLIITIISKLHNVLIDSAIRVDTKIITALESNEHVDILS